MAIDYSKWTEADTNLIDTGKVTMAELEAYNSQKGSSGSTTPTNIVNLKSAGIKPGQDIFGDDMNAADYGGFKIDPNAQIFQDARARDAQMAQTDAINARYGSDLSWLDPSFQQTPQMLGQSQGSQTYANPQDVAAQQSVYNSLGGMVGKDMGYAGAGQQQGMFNQWGGVAAGQGAPQFQSGAQQQQLLGQIGQLANPTWGSDAKQQEMYGQVGNMSGPQFGSAADQQAVSARYNQRASGSGAPQFVADADQRSVLNDLASVAKSGGAQGLALDNGARQGEQYGNLQDIIAGGGATKIEMANRQAQRMDQEQWLRSQREADQKAAEARGMSGSGSELLSIAADRQAAAGRNSLADLQTAAQLEQRRTDAIGQAGSLAGQMRGQTNDAEFSKAARGDQARMAQGSMANQLSADDFRNKSYEDQTRLQALGGQANMTNQLRQAAYQEGMGRNQAELQKYGLQSDLANTMRSQQYQEQAFDAGYGLDKLNAQANISAQDRAQTNAGLQYNDARAMNALQQQTALANQLRSDQYNEANATRGYDLQALGAQGGLATNMRNASTQEGQFRANSADQFSQLNQSAYNTAAANNAQFLQNSYQNMMNNRQTWEQNKLATGVNVAGTIQNFDDRQNQAAYTGASGLAAGSADAFNTANANANSTKLAAATGGNAQVLAANQQYNNAFGTGVGKTFGAFGDTVATMAGGPPSGGAGAGGAGATTGGATAAPQTQLQMPQMGSDYKRFTY